MKVGVRLLTCSPLSRFLAIFTFPILPAPIVLPSAHWPDEASIVVLRRAELELPGGTFAEESPVGFVGVASAYRAYAPDLGWLRWDDLTDSVRAECDRGIFCSRDELLFEDCGRARFNCSWSLSATLPRFPWYDEEFARPRFCWMILLKSQFGQRHLRQMHHPILHNADR